MIEAADPAGRAYARNHLADLRAARLLPETAFTIEEVPRFAERGFMLDISRCRVPRMETLFGLVEQLEQLRYNQLQLYTEHTFAYAEHRTVWKDASPLTGSEIRELDAYCREHHIELVPNQNCFGHMERWLRHPAYRELAESPDGFTHPILGWRPYGSTLHPSDKSADFVKSLLAELIPHFSSKKINVGGDEPWELGQGRSAGRVAEVGKAEVYRGFLERILRTAMELGSEPIFWADIVLEHPELVPKIPEEAVPAIWGYYGNHPYPEQCHLVAEAGFRGRFQVVPGTGSWNSWTGRLDDATANIRLAAREGFRHGARGLVLTCWGDGGHQQPTPTMFPGLVLAARASWADGDTDAHLGAAIDRVFYPDRPAGNGEALLALGRIDGVLPDSHPNRSFLHSVFFASGEELPQLRKGIDPDRLEDVQKILDRADAEDLDPRVRFASEASQWALDRLKGGESEQDLASRSDDLKRTFRELWLSESREGGLEESLGSFVGS